MYLNDRETIFIIKKRDNPINSEDGPVENVFIEDLSETLWGSSILLAANTAVRS